MKLNDLTGQSAILCAFLWVNLAGCTSQPNSPATTPAPLPAALPPELAQFNWLLTADAAKDAKQAIANQDYRLLAISGRGSVLPGIAASQAKQVKQQCRYKFMSGMGDVIKGDVQRKWWKKGYQYAKDYNALVLGYCFEG